MWLHRCSTTGRLDKTLRALRNQLQPVPPINSDRHRNPGVFGAPATGFAGAPKDVQLMTRRGDLKLSHGATAKVRENAVKQDRVRVTNAIGHHPERFGFLRRTEFIGGTGLAAQFAGMGYCAAPPIRLGVHSFQIHTEKPNGTHGAPLRPVARLLHRDRFDD